MINEHDSAWDNAKGGGKPVGNANMIGDISAAVGNVALKSAQNQHKHNVLNFKATKNKHRAAGNLAVNVLLPTTTKLSGTKTINNDARDLVLRAIAALIKDQPQEVIAILNQFQRPVPQNPTATELADAVSKGFANADFMGALMLKANANFQKYISADGWYNAKGGGKAAGMSGNMIGDIANAVGNVALASAQITASVMEVKKAKVENKSKLLEYVTSTDTNKTTKQIAQIQAAAQANLHKKDNTVPYVIAGVVTFAIIIGAVLVIKNKQA